jgi:hypothetical protein
VVRFYYIFQLMIISTNDKLSGILTAYDFFLIQLPLKFWLNVRTFRFFLKRSYFETLLGGSPGYGYVLPEVTQNLVRLYEYFQSFYIDSRVERQFFKKAFFKGGRPTALNLSDIRASYDFF